jgi:membrane-associated phospholipid phosphatase
MDRHIIKVIGLAGSFFALSVFITQPSFPTPDKLLVFGILVAMIFSQGIEFLRRFGPFVIMLLVYESFRGLVPNLNTRVDYTILPAIDRFLFLGTLPTTSLQAILWNGSVQWYDFMFYIPYMLHFVLPLVLGIWIWKKRERYFWIFVTAYISVSFAGFFTYLLFPAAPPWMASDLGYIEPITRISSSVWFALGVNDFPSLYNAISPNPVAAFPSLHAAYATLFALFVTKLVKGNWKYVAWIYPLLIYIGTVYQGEHYAIDELAGAVYAAAGFYLAPRLLNQITKLGATLHNVFLKTNK